MDLKLLKEKLPDVEGDGYSIWYEVKEDCTIKHYRGMWNNKDSVVVYEPTDTEDSVVQKFKEHKDVITNTKHYDLD